MRAKAAILLATALLLPLLTAAVALADGSEASGADTEISLEAGGRYADTDGNRTFIYPYSPMDSGPVLRFDLFHIKPGGRSLEIGGDYGDDQDWSAGLRYNQGASFKIGVGARQFYHALEHREFPPGFETPAPGYDTVHTEYDDANPDADYHSDIKEYTGDFTVRIPSYPAHIKGSGRVYRKEGPRQMEYFFRTCSTHICHVNSRTRDIDTETQEYNLGFDSHVGPVDVVYNYNRLLFEDQAPDPVDFYGDFSSGPRLPGDYSHAVVPDTKSWSNELRVNTNLTNRAVLALDYVGGKSENDDVDLSEKSQRFTAKASYTASRLHFFSLSYIYLNIEDVDVGEEVAMAREAVGRAVNPETTENAGELSWRWTPRTGTQLHAHLRYTDLGRKDTDRSGLPGSTSTWSADLDGKVKVSRALELEAELAGEWTEDPAFATDFTDLWRVTLGALWEPARPFSLLARYSGSFGKNDDEAALSRGYYEPESLPGDLNRDSDGHSLLAMLTWTPAEALSCVLSYNYSLNDISQDQLLGTASYPDRVFLSEGTPFESTYQIGSLEVVWAATKALRFSVGGMVLAGEESWEPEVAGRPDLTEGLEDIARVDFTKYMADAEVRYEFAGGMGLTLAGFYADYDDKVSDGGDGKGGGVMATVSKRW